LNNECLIGLESTEDLLSKVLESPTGRGQMLSSSKRHKAISDALKILQNPPYTLIDSPEWIADNEYAILGVALTCSKIDGCDHLGANITCSEFKNTLLKTISIASEIIDVKITKTKKGKNPGSEMAFVTISDSIGSVDSVILFPEAFSEFKDLIEPGNTVVISGNKNKEGDSLIVKKIWQV
jgi:DNA polymerase III alpha subunit